MSQIKMQIMESKKGNEGNEKSYKQHKKVININIISPFFGCLYDF